MQTIAVSGAAGPLGRRLVETLAAAADVEQVVAVDPLRSDLKTALEGADAVIHLGWGPLGDEPEAVGSGDTVEAARRVLDAAGSVDAGHLVVVSSATVYGAWPTNPLPLTEDTPIKPNPGFAPAIEAAEVERLAAGWRDQHPGAVVTVLRPVMTVAPDHPGWLARALRSALAFPVGDHDPPTQFLHVDDLAAAVEAARQARLAGPYNVAPDGWLEGAARRALDVRPRFRVPEAVAARVAGWRWKLGMAPTPPELIPYVAHPWVVANDRLRAAGWSPSHTNEEAWVAAHPGGPLATMSPRRRQELILGGSVAALLAAATGVVVWLRRRSR